MGPQAGMPGMGGQPNENDPNVTVLHITRDNSNVKIRYKVALKDAATVGQLIATAISASGALAIPDGLFDGSLTGLNRAFQEWAAAKPDNLVGMRRMGEQMAVWAGYSWMTELLPYVGRDDLYGKFDFTKSWADPVNDDLSDVVIPAFLNPADPRTNWVGFPLGGKGLTHFAGMSGVEDGRNIVAAELPRTDPRAGIFGYDRIAKASDITDGTSQTIMMIGAGEAVGPWVSGGGSTIRGARQPYFDKFTGFGSRGLQKTGTYVLFADGSARVISGDIDPEVFKAMCTMHGAEQIDMTKLVSQDR